MAAVVPFITAHAIERYQLRVAPWASRREALRAIREILSQAKASPRPRHWMNVNASSGCRYLYSADCPGVCLVLRGGAVVTVFSRACCLEWRPSPRGSAAGTQPYRRPWPDAGRNWEAA